MLLYIALLIYILFAALLIYIVAPNSTLLNLKQCRTENALYLVLVMLPITILSAFRASNIGNDTSTYIALYQSISSLNILENERYEHGYLLYNRILNSISTHPQFLLIVTSIIVSLIIGAWILRFSELPWLSIYLFITMSYFSLSMSGLRQFMAMLITIIAFCYVLKRKVKQFMLLVLLAFFFHRTAIIFLIAYPLSYFPVNKKTVAFMLGGTAICYVGLQGMLSILFRIFPIYSYYLGGKYMDGDIRVASLLNAAVSATILVVGGAIHISTRNRAKEHLTEFVSKVSNAGIAFQNADKTIVLYILMGFCITILSFPFNLLARAGDYFSIFTLIYLPNILNKIQNREVKAILLATVVLLFGLYFMVVQIVRPEWNHIYPYQFWWNS